MFFTSIAARTDLGLLRTGNEDSALHHPRLIAVADGMGGAVGGEIASKIAIDTVKERIETITSEDIDDDSRLDLLQGTLVEIEARLAARIKADPTLNGMGTTLTALIPLDRSIAMLHIGDSRAYRIRANEITRLSHDHTVVQELIDQGKISQREALDHPQRSMLTQALMGKNQEYAHLENYPVQIFPASKGDLYLVASDGLTAVLEEEMIAKVAQASSNEQAVNNLVTMVRDGGAPDNVTVILAGIAESVDDPGETTLLGAAYE